MSYRPDNWILVKIAGTHPHYRVFAVWRGGYINGDSWRMNSGVVGVDEDDDYYYFKGHSGSVYECHKLAYGRIGGYGSSVLYGYVENSAGTLEVIQEMPDVMNIEWSPN